MPEHLPKYDLDLRSDGGQAVVFDPLRKKYIVATPEEYVRQCLVRWLMQEKQVPAGLMSVERGVKVNSLGRRYDLVVYDSDGSALLCAECKAPGVALDESALRQLVVYNSELNAMLLLLTNGIQLNIFSRDETGRYQLVEFLKNFREWKL